MAHALKKICSEDQLKSFETGVKYQMYHALLLLILSFNLKLETDLQQGMVYCIIIGVFLFSFSIYGLCISSAKGKKLNFFRAYYAPWWIYFWLLVGACY